MAKTKQEQYAQKIVQSKQIIQELKLETEQVTKRDIGEWRRAHQTALSVENPKRNILYNIYDFTVDIDDTVTGVALRTKYGIMKRCFQMVDSSGKEDANITAIFHSEWFKEYMSIALDAHYYGHSLVELGDVISINGLMSFTSVRLIPRRHVCPEYGVILPEASDEPNKGLPFRNGDLSKYVVESGSSFNLGAYLKICPQTISKKNAQIFWDNFAERFGIPILYATIDSRDVGERIKTTNMLKGIGSNAWALFGADVKLNVIETRTGDAFEVFDRRIMRADQQISMSLAGQTMSFTDGASLSQAEVHERGFTEVKDNIAGDLENNINNRLLPKMAAMGFPVNGFRFKWNDARQYTAEEQLKIEELLLKYYDIPKEHFENKYGVKIEGVKQQSSTSLSLQRQPMDFFC